MSNITTINRPTERQTPIEIALQIDGQGMTTARALYEFLDLAPSQFSRWAKKQIEKSIFFFEHKDWEGFDTMSSGNLCKDYRITVDMAKHLAMSYQNAKGKEARDYFIQVEQNAKKFANNVQPSTQAQLLVLYAQQFANQEKMLMEHDKKITEVQSKVEAVKEVLSPPEESWREMIIKNITGIAKDTGIEYRDVWTDCYEELDRHGFDIKKRLKNCQKRMEKMGCSKTAVSKIKKIDIIERDPKAKEIFTNIVSKMVLKHVI